MTTATDAYVRAATLAEVRAAGCLPVRVQGHTLVLFSAGDTIHALDNRCPHMGFPLDRGTVRDGILTCHWHHARFDLASGGAFDLFADDVPVFPVEVRNDEVWVDPSPHGDRVARQRERLRDGLERNISLVVGKAAIGLLAAEADPTEPLRLGLDFGVRYRQSGWGPGLTVLTCMSNLLPHLDADDRPRALFHGLAAVAVDCASQPARFAVRPLPDDHVDLAALQRWFRQFVEVRDSDGAERCIVSAIRAGAGHRELAGMLFAAATDHRYIQIGHPLDFTNKALEALDKAGWELAEPVLASLAAGYASASRMEESNAWRNPEDLIEILAMAFVELPVALRQGLELRGVWSARESLVSVLLGERPQAIADALLESLREGATETDLAASVAYAAALRLARFHTSNDFGDWDTALHTFTFANAVHQGLIRVASPELLRGVFDAAMSVYLDRFLNVPAARLPEPDGAVADPQVLLTELSELLDRQQQVNQAGDLVARYLHAGGAADRLQAALGSLLLREDRDFHTIQMLEAAFRQHSLLGDAPAGTHVMVAAARYLAAHAPTSRAQGQTYGIALRLHRSERLYEDD